MNRPSTYISIDGQIKGHFVFRSKFREGIDSLMHTLSSKYHLHILSVDTAKDADYFSATPPFVTDIHFKQSPNDKFQYVQRLHEASKHVMMIGDGLNDSGALKSADVGIAISEDVFQFTPSTDAI